MVKFWVDIVGKEIYCKVKKEDFYKHTSKPMKKEDAELYAKNKNSQGLKTELRKF